MQRFSVIVSTVLMAGVLGALAFAHAAGATDPYAAGDQAQGAKLVQSSACEGCHGAGLTGGGAAPKLVGIEKRLTPEQIADRIKNPKPPMPSLGFKEKQLANIVAYLSNLDGGWGAPVVKIEPARPSSDATVLVTFSGTPPKDVQVEAEMQMGTMSHGTGWLPLERTKDEHVLSAKVHFTMGGPWTIKVRYPGGKTITLPVNVEG